MGLFSRKKKMDVPEPPSEDILRLPKPLSKDTGLEKIKEAVGIGKSLPELPPQKEELPELPELPDLDETGLPSLPSEPMPSFSHQRPMYIIQKPFFLKMHIYQELFNSLDSIRKKSLELDQKTKDLEESEFNENKHYERLKNDLKKVHDQLLKMDDILFKR